MQTNNIVPLAWGCLLNFGSTAILPGVLRPARSGMLLAVLWGGSLEAAVTSVSQL